MAQVGVIVAATFAVTIPIGEFGATALVARDEFPTMPVAIYRFLSRPGALIYGQGLTLSTILMLSKGGGMLLIERLRIAEVLIFQTRPPRWPNCSSGWIERELSIAWVFMSKP